MEGHHFNGSWISSSRHYSSHCNDDSRKELPNEVNKFCKTFLSYKHNDVNMSNHMFKFIYCVKISA
uniref:Uncharacterized protein n=1 Tax=Rhizophora mucronata TaxID=61149 RepID=A0A2P2LZ92_RHIMU